MSRVLIINRHQPYKCARNMCAKDVARFDAHLREVLRVHKVASK